MKNFVRGQKQLKIAIGQMEVIPARPDLNFAKIQRLVVDAKNEKAELLVLPELCLSGYLIGDMWEEESFIDDCDYYGEEIRRLADGIAIAFGNVTTVDGYGHDGRVRKVNALFVAQNRRWETMCNKIGITYQPKALLPNYREFEEPRHFMSFIEVAREIYNQDVKELYKPIRIGSYDIGFTICEDGWDQDYETKPMKILGDAGADILINLSCSPYTRGKNDSRDRVFGNHARTNNVPVIYCNAVGLQNNGKTIYTFDGSSVVYNVYGEKLIELGSFNDTLQCIDLPCENSYNRDYKYSELEIEEWLDTGIPEVYNALKYGVKKYCEQSGLKRVVIGISGGIDSAVVAGLYVDVLGPENVMLVNMPSRFNSDTTKSIAKSIADSLQCLYTTIPIEESIGHTKEQIDGLMVSRMGYATGSVLQLSNFNMENVQARDRSSRILAAVASAWGAVFTNNGNKTEATVGYCTIYGDVAGFLAVLGDIWKEDVYALGRHINKVFGYTVIPEETFNIAASAELSADQGIDEGEGDPLVYWYHDALFRTWVERWNRCNIVDVAKWYRDGTLLMNLGVSVKRADDFNQRFPTAEAFFEDLERWWKLFRGMGLAKRVQAPPILAISRRAYGFDYREALNTAYIGREYYQIKEEFLSK